MLTGGHIGRGGGRTEEQMGRVGGRTDDQGGRGNRANGGVDKVLDFTTVIAQQLQYLLPTVVAQVGDHVSNQRNIRSENNNIADDNIHEDDRNVNVGNDRNGCSYKEFVACKPKEFDGKCGTVACIHWVKKMEAVQDISGCACVDNQKVKYSAGSLTGRALTWWNSKSFRVTPWLKLVMQRTLTDFMSLLGTELPMIHNSILKAGVLTDEAVRNGSLKRNGGESIKEGNVKNDNKRARTRTVFATITNPVKKEYTGHFARDCRAGPRMLNLLNDRNPTVAHGACYECGGTDFRILWLLGIVIPAAKFFISVGVLFLLLEYSMLLSVLHCCCQFFIAAVSTSLLLLARIIAVKQIVIVS
uniref:Reverse transcriptase domain-containing protein n=1 Tax=Tanacetum cinerariifolium TaxID=118510 RepID=A0A699H5R0_TANCI|nr:reverse transcriptase domain-containing protein [Tanacetum cinerariifolium]